MLDLEDFASMESLFAHVPEKPKQVVMVERPSTMVRACVAAEPLLQAPPFVSLPKRGSGTKTVDLGDAMMPSFVAAKRPRGPGVGAGGGVRVNAGAGAGAGAEMLSSAVMTLGCAAELPGMVSPDSAGWGDGMMVFSPPPSHGLEDEDEGDGDGDGEDMPVAASARSVPAMFPSPATTTTSAGAAVGARGAGGAGTSSSGGASKKRKTAEEKRQEDEAKLARLEADRAIGRTTVTDARAALEGLLPLLRKIVAADPKLAAMNLVGGSM